MGFDPRHWSASTTVRDGVDRAARHERVTSNVEALLRENDSLRREVRRLQLALDRAQQQQKQQQQKQWRQEQWRQEQGEWQQGASARPHHWTGHDHTSERFPRVSRDQVRRWGASLARQPGWTALRQLGLALLIEQLNRHSFHSDLSLQQRLDRLVAGLGTDLFTAVGSGPTKKTTAVLAAFALYGVRASEWLDEDPARVVNDLRQRSHQANSSNDRRTRSDRRATDRDPSNHDSPGSGSRNAREEAFSVLGLRPGCSQEAIKQAFRRLVKQHHPDVGGSAEAFQRVKDAYQVLAA